jgi:uncharacterized protein (TIGR02145 family)
MKIIKPKKLTTRNLAKFLIAFAVLVGGVFGFQYLVNAMAIVDVTPNAGSTAGGQEVMITGDFAIAPAMQEMSVDYCDNEMSIYPTDDSKPDTVTLTDIRNGQEYRVRKLADGKCWMIDNLKLELTDGMILTPQDTNVTTDTTVALAAGGLTGNFTTENYLTADNTNATGTDYDNYNAWRQANPNDPNSANTIMCRTDDGLTYNKDSTTGCGYYYNFYTATAGTADNTKITGTAEGSICPAGWRLPTGATSGDFANLDKIYPPGIGDYHTSDLSLQNLWLSAGAWQGTLGGGYSSTFISQGSAALYWSSSVFSVNNTYYTYFNGGGVRPGTISTARNSGFPVRCIIDENRTPTPVVPVVTIGGEAAQITAWSDTAITVIAPAHSAGKVDVIVTRGSQTFTLTNAYEYFNVPDVPNTGAAKTSATTTAVQSGLAALIIMTIGTAIFIIRHRKARR